MNGRLRKRIVKRRLRYVMLVQTVPVGLVKVQTRVVVATSVLAVEAATEVLEVLAVDRRRRVRMMMVAPPAVTTGSPIHLLLNKDVLSQMKFARDV
jgi:hypothetical protein